MSNQYYQLSTDYELADKLLKQGLSVIQQINGNDFYAFKNNAGLGRFDHLIEVNAQFLLPVPDPTIELQHSLAAALNECDELREDLVIQKTNAENLSMAACENFKFVKELQNENAKLKEELTLARMNAECFAESGRESLNDIRNLSSLIAQKDEQIDDLQSKNDILMTMAVELKAWRDKDRQDMESRNTLVNEKCKIKQEIIEKLTKELVTRHNKIKILEDNLNRSNSDRLSQLTSIMRMVQALEDTPAEKNAGAIYLIKRVLFEAICKLDPSQAVDL